MSRKLVMSRKLIVLPISTIVLLTFVALNLVTFTPVRDITDKKTQSTSEVLQKLTFQGWAYFTKSPRSEITVPYTKNPEEDYWRTAQRGPNVQAKYLFGLNRQSRLTEFDVDVVSKKISESSWSACPVSTEINSCLDAKRSSVISGEPNQEIQLCGDVALVRYSPTPWAFRKNPPTPSRLVVVVRIECNLSE